MKEACHPWLLFAEVSDCYERSLNKQLLLWFKHGSMTMTGQQLQRIRRCSMVQVGYTPRFGLYAIYTSVCNLYIFLSHLVYIPYFDLIILGFIGGIYPIVWTQLTWWFKSRLYLNFGGVKFTATVWESVS